MSFLETPRFPDRISLRMEGGPTWSTKVVILSSGYEQRNIEWSAARMRYNIGVAITSQTELDEIISWMRCLRGRGHGFRIKDPIDYSATTSEGYVGTAGTGDGTPTGQMYKVYSVGALSETRLISKPVTGTCTFYVDGVADSGASLDTTTGIVTWSALDSASITGAVPASGDATTLSLADALSGAQVGDKVYITGISGTIGTPLNSAAHTIQAISGSPNSVLDLATDTDGLAYTSGGTAYLYPQSRHALRWAGQFDVPVRFDLDALRLLIKTIRFQRFEDVPLVEIRV